MTGQLEPRPLAGIQPPRRSVGGLTFVETRYLAGTFIEPHAHSAASLSLVLCGEYLEKIDRRERHCSTRMLLTHPRGAIHSNQHGKSEVRMISISLAAEQEAELPPLRSLGEPVETAGPEIDRCGRVLARELREPGSASSLALTALTFELLAKLERIGESTGRPPQWLRAVVDRLRDERGSTPTLFQLAREVDVHPAHLARSFRRHLGSSVGEFARASRLNRARIALECDQDSIAAIAAENGFADQSHFTRHFTRSYGVSPAKWRAQGRGACLL